MRIKSTFTIIIAVFIIGLLLFFISYHRRVHREANRQLERHAMVIANSLWGFEKKAPGAYLRLAAQLNDYERIVVTENDGNEFVSIRGPRPGKIERLLDRVGLTPLHQIQTNVIYKDKAIGVIIVDRRDKTIFTYLYILFCLLAILPGVWFFLRLTIAKKTLEARVKERTAALQESRERLRLNEERLDLALDGANDGIWDWRLDDDAVHFDARYYTMAGYEPYEFPCAFDEWVKRVHPDDIRRVKENVEQYLAGDLENYEVEFRFLRKDGGYMWIRGRGKIVARDEKGSPTRFVGTHSDITGRKRVEEELRRHQEHLEELVDERTRELGKEKERAEIANSAKSEFLANMSHEIRTPMNGVVGMTDLLLRTELTATQKDYADAISISANSLLTVINDILDFSKIQAGKLDLESTRFCLRDVVERICQLFAGQGKDKPIEILVRYPMDAPSHIIGDSTRMRQILTNLVGNAFKFTKQGHVLVDVACEKKDEERGEFIFNITDTGVGIPGDRLQGIFDQFSQGDESTTRQFGGTGLGLSICKQLVEMMGGEIGVESEPGKGSTFHFRLEFPCVAEPVLDEKIKAELSEISVLVVDDNEVNKTIALEYLGSWSIPCDGAGSAAEALDRLRRAKQERQPFKIVIIDYFMPGMNGGDLAEAIKADEEISDTLLILLSSGVIDRELSASTRAYFTASLSKPIRLSLFLNTLTAVWRQYRNGDSGRSDPALPASDQGAEALIIRADVLLVEDNHINQRVASGILGRYGCRVDVAENGREAVDRVREKAFDVIFMDANMPVMDGFEATREIREIEESGTRTPIIAMTALAMAGDRERCLEAGMDDYISKPVKSKDIFDILVKYGPESRMESIEDKKREEQARGDEASGGGEAAVLNPSRLLDIGDHDEELILELIDEFMKDAPALLDILRNAVDSGDQNRIAIKAHKLNGLAANFGGERFLEMGLAIENAAREGAFDPGEMKPPLLAAELEKLKQALVETDWGALCGNSLNR